MSVNCGESMKFGMKHLRATMPIAFYTASHGMKVFAQMKLPILSADLMPWKETTCGFHLTFSSFHCNCL